MYVLFMYLCTVSLFRVKGKKEGSARASHFFSFQATTTYEKQWEETERKKIERKKKGKKEREKKERKKEKLARKP